MRDKSLYHPVAARTQPTPPAQPAQPAQPMGALSKRRIFDAIRGAYDLGYNDARNARTVPGDSAPGYKGRDVEVDHGGALIWSLEAQPAPVVPDLTDAELNAIWVDQDNAGRRMNFRLGYRLAQKLATPKPSIQDLTDRARAKGVVAVAQDAPVVPAWQSIETAPKGGVLVDILCDGRRYAGCHYDRICDEFRHITACGVLVHLKKASHWMAVPAAPQPLPLHNV